MRNRASHGAFSLKGLPEKATALVIGEDRRITIGDGRFDDDFLA